MSREYLITEPFVSDALQARVLQAAFELGIIDRLQAVDVVSADQLFHGDDCDPAGGEFLLQMLAKSGVLRVSEQRISLTETFRSALQFRDLMVTKLNFSNIVAADFFEKMPQLLKSAEDFMATAKLFELFDYGRCVEVTTANCMQASRWMQLTTMLTRYEAPVCHQHYDFSEHQNMLDIGGNSGEFALQICRRTPELRATVLDLPVVCQVGQRHLQPLPEASRIEFRPADMLRDPFPEGFDLITWKSVLHDWPEEHMSLLLHKTFDSLPPGGTVLIFERQRWDFSVEDTPYGLLPVMLFFRSYRQPDAYQAGLQQAGFTKINVQQIRLEVPFLLITATKP